MITLEEIFNKNLTLTKNHLRYSMTDGLLLRVIKYCLRLDIWDCIYRKFMTHQIKYLKNPKFKTEAKANSKLLSLMDCYTTATFILLFLLYFLSYFLILSSSNFVLFTKYLLSLVLLSYPVYRIVELFSRTIALHIKPTYQPKNYGRALLLAFLDYVEIVISFAIFYLHCFFLTNDLFSNDICNSSIIASAFEPFYFSFVTITTLGYGDLSPQYFWGKLMVVIQLFLGLIYIIFFIQKTVSSSKR